MKTHISLFAFALSALAVAQGVFTYSDQAGSLSVKARSALVTPGPNGTYKFVLKGQVTVDSKNQGLKMTAQQIDLDAVQNSQQKTRNDIRKALATGGVVALKTTTTPRGRRTTQITGSRADYSTKGAEGTLIMRGPVTITDTDAAQSKNMVATGSSGVANLVAGGASAKSPVRTATLQGSVRVVILQSAQAGGKRSTIVATGSKLVLDNMSSPPTLTLTGTVTMQGREPGSFGVVQNVNKAVLTLNENGEMTGFQVGS